MPTWTVDGLDFVLLCERYGRDRLPYPLKVRIDAERDDQYRQMRREATARIESRLDDNLDSAMRTLVDPLVRIEVRGETLHSRRSVVRSHAAVRHESATVLVQRPGVDSTAGGAVTIELSSPEYAAQRVLGPLPPKAAGGLPSTRIDRSRSTSASLQSTRGAGETVMTTATRRSTSQERYRAFFGRERSGVGEIIVAAGPTLDNRADKDSTAFYWMDFEDDGRYIVYVGDFIDLAPADTTAVASEIRRHMYATLRK